jgi:hypothetical protein
MEMYASFVNAQENKNSTYDCIEVDSGGGLPKFVKVAALLWGLLLSNGLLLFRT